MKIVIDTNIVLDILAKREPFFENSHAVILLAAQGKLSAAITANSITDIYYIMRKSMNNEALKSALRELIELLEIITVGREQCLDALELPMTDFEDALLASCAKTWDASCIVTRNIKDFVDSPIKALSPSDFVKNIDL